MSYVIFLEKSIPFFRTKPHHFYGSRAQTFGGLEAKSCIIEHKAWCYCLLYRSLRGLYSKLPFAAHRWHTNKRGNKLSPQSTQTDDIKYVPDPQTHQTPKQTMSVFASLDTSCSSNPLHRTFSPPSLPPLLLSSPLSSPLPPSHPHHHCLNRQSVFFPRFIFTVLFAARQEEEVGVEGWRGWEVRTDGVAMETPHWHASDWTTWWLIIQRICLKKTIK